MAKKTINISDYFCTTREKEGVWYEAKLGNGTNTGIEFKILGPSSDENAIAAEAYSKQHDEIEKEKDPKIAAKMQREAVCKRIAAVITDIRGKDGMQLVNDDGTEIKYSYDVVYKILDENIEIRTDLLNALFETSTFMKKKN